MTKVDLHELVDALPEQAVDSFGALMRRVISGEIEAEQLWFWTPEWQRKEREIDERLARGERGTVHQSSEEFLAALDERTHRRVT